MSAITDLLDGFVDTFREPVIIKNWRLRTIDEWKPGYVRKNWLVEKEHLMGSTLFSGCIAAPADQMLAFPAITLQKDGEFCSTSNLSLTYLKPVKEGELIIEAKVVSRTKKSFYVEAKFTRAAGLMVKASETQLTANKDKY